MKLYNESTRASPAWPSKQFQATRPPRWVISRAIAALNSLPRISDQCKEIRQNFTKEYLGGGLVFLSSGELVPRNGDVFHPFRACSDFLYLSGLNEPSYSILMDTEDGKMTLFAPKQPPEVAFWMGPQPTLEALAEEIGADRVLYQEDLSVCLEAAGDRMIHTTDGGSQAALEKALGGSHKQKTVSGLLEKTLSRVRAVKTESEVRCILDANIISGSAHQDVWRQARPGQFEFEMEAIFRSTCMRSGYSSLGYPAIIGSGSNSAILHYETNRRRANEGELVLIDAGAESRCYTADITRTFPVSGAFSPLQSDVYDACLSVQEEALGILKPGLLLSDVALATRQKLLSCLVDIGIVKKGLSIELLLAKSLDRTFMPHGLSHFLGLDVHDVGPDGPVPKQKLQIGNVITIEPGIYFIDALLAKASEDPELSKWIDWDKVDRFKDFGGVRIEDNVLITNEGIRNLTMEAGVPKTRQEIEDVMRGGS